MEILWTTAIALIHSPPHRGQCLFSLPIYSCARHGSSTNTEQPCATIRTTPPVMNDQLPITDPAAGLDKPLDNDAHVDTSSTWAPWYLIFLTRVFSACTLAGAGLVITFQMNLTIVQPAFFLNAVGFAFLAIVTGLQSTKRTNNLFAKILLYFYGFTACFAVAVPLDLLDRFANKRLTFHPILLLYLIPALHYFIDVFVMSARLRLRYSCAFVATLCFFVARLTQTLIRARMLGHAVFGAVLFVVLYTLTFLMVSCVVVCITRVFGRNEKEDTQPTSWQGAALVQWRKVVAQFCNINSSRTNQIRRTASTSTMCYNYRTVPPAVDWDTNYVTRPSGTSE